MSASEFASAKGEFAGDIEPLLPFAPEPQSAGEGTRRRRCLAETTRIPLFWPAGGGKSHLAAASGFALIENGWRVLFARTTDLVQKLQIARRDLVLEAAIAKPTIRLLILDDLAYVSKDQAETSVLFELISARYERRSLLITANQPFGKWGRIFPDQAMTLAAIDRLVHHATIFELNVDSYRRKTAVEKTAPWMSVARDNQKFIFDSRSETVKSVTTKKLLASLFRWAISSGRDRFKAILFVAALPSRLSRYSVGSQSTTPASRFSTSIGTSPYSVLMSTRVISNPRG